jgi:hypothetical protein
MAQIALKGSACPAFELFEQLSVLRDVRLRHDTDREDAALLPIPFDLSERKTFRRSGPGFPLW